MLDHIVAIPPHDPDRHDTTDGLDNPDCTNGNRTSTALEALDCFQNACHMVEDVDTAAADLVGNLLHLAHSRGHDPKRVLQDGLGHFLYESSKCEHQYVE